MSAAAAATPTPFEQGQQAAAASPPLSDAQAARVATLLSLVTTGTSGGAR